MQHTFKSTESSERDKPITKNTVFDTGIFKTLHEVVETRIIIGVELSFKTLSVFNDLQSKV